jgi:hypothetical protein
MSQEKPTPYTLEFKLSDVKLTSESNKPMPQTAKNLGVNPKEQRIFSSFENLLLVLVICCP